jgi:arabinofuranan 3-O-arabinosyltransferase
VRENTNAGWVASIDGVALTPVIVDGWQQGWAVPAGLSGQVELRFPPDRTFRAGLLVGAAALLIVALVALIPSRRRLVRDAGTTAPPARAGVILPLTVGGAGLLVTAGVLGGLIVSGAVAVLAYQVRAPRRAAGETGALAGWRAVAWAFVRRVLRLVWWLAPPAALLLGGIAWLVVYEPAKDYAPQVLGILAVAAVWLATVLTSRPRRAEVPARLRRMRSRFQVMTSRSPGTATTHDAQRG